MRGSEGLETGSEPSRDTEERSRGSALAVLLATLTALLLAGVVIVLGASPDDQYQVIIGGLAGAAASSIARLLRGGGLSEMEDTLAKHGAVAVFIPIITGLAAGAFSVLTALALFGSSNSLASGAVLGGIYGLLLGGWVNSLVYATKASEETTIIGAALAEIAVGQARKYNGDVRARFDPEQRDQTRVLGSLRIVFVPKNRTVADQESWVQGPVRIDSGQVADQVPFEVSLIVESGLAAYPRVREVLVPATEVSDDYSFTIVKDGAPRAEAAAIPSVPTVIVDIAQAGRTVQLLELPLKGSSLAEGAGEALGDDEVPPGAEPARSPRI